MLLSWTVLDVLFSCHLKKIIAFLWFSIYVDQCLIEVVVQVSYKPFFFSFLWRLKKGWFVVYEEQVLAQLRGISLLSLQVNKVSNFSLQCYTCIMHWGQESKGNDH